MRPSDRGTGYDFQILNQSTALKNAHIGQRCYKGAFYYGGHFIAGFSN